MNRPRDVRRRILVVVESVNDWEQLLAWARTFINPHDSVLVAMLCEHHGGYESDAVPFLSHTDFLQQTERDLRERIRPLLLRLELPFASFRLLEGAANQTVAELATLWVAELILTRSELARRIQGYGGFLGLLAPVPLPCPLLTLSTPPCTHWTRWLARLQAWLAQENP
ncbi:MAG: hypothetical protein HQL80_01950 [Magnetococcales bacterium]|nr:hypothetical protein [Magnetococcales bacterium]